MARSLPADWPEIGEYDGEPAFLLPARSLTLSQRLVFAMMTPVMAVVAVLELRDGVWLGGTCTAALVTALVWRLVAIKRRGRGAFVMTRTRLGVWGGSVQRVAEWDAITSVGERAVQGAVFVQARLSRPVVRTPARGILRLLEGSPLVLSAPSMFVPPGLSLHSAVQWYARDPGARELIGTEEGRRRLRSVLGA